MYTSRHYVLLSEMNRIELRKELDRANERLNFYQICGENGEVKLDTMFKGIQNCENYIIEIERRLGVYNSEITKMLLKRSIKGYYQKKGITPSVISQAVEVEIDTSDWFNVYGAKRYRKFTYKGEVKEA